MKKVFIYKIFIYQDNIIPLAKHFIKKNIIIAKKKISIIYLSFIFFEWELDTDNKLRYSQQKNLVISLENLNLIVS